MGIKNPSPMMGRPPTSIESSPPCIPTQDQIPSTDLQFRASTSNSNSNSNANNPSPPSTNKASADENYDNDQNDGRSSRKNVSRLSSITSTPKDSSEPKSLTPRQTNVSSTDESGRSQPVSVRQRKQNLNPTAITPVATATIGNADRCKLAPKIGIQSPPAAAKPKATSQCLPKNMSYPPKDLVVVIIVWYMLGVVSICTTKLLLTHEDFAMPPLVVTFQQFVMSSSLVYALLSTVQKGPLTVQKLPSANTSWNPFHNSHTVWYDFVLAGLFNGLDFLASNTSFSSSSASFVETIKASEPITTTAIAMLFGIDRLRTPEGISLICLISGVMCATMGNVVTSNNDDDDDPAATQAPAIAYQSIRTCCVVMTANLCFAMRAKCQKGLRKHPEGKRLNDVNLLMRMHQVGALSLFLPVLIFESPGILQRTLRWEMGSYSLHFPKEYLVLALVNTVAFVSYNFASCYVLTKLSVVQHTGLGCLRRMFCIISTSILFGVPISPLGVFGILLCFGGFCSFTYFRHTLPPLSLDDNTVSHLAAKNATNKLVVPRGGSNGKTTTVSPKAMRRMVNP